MAKKIMKLSIFVVLLLFGLLCGEGQGVPIQFMHLRNREATEVPDDDPINITGNFRFQFYRWTDPDTNQVIQLYPSQSITPSDINTLLSYLNEFFLTAAKAYHTATFGGDNIAESPDIVSMNYDDCRFATNPYQDATFWCTATFNFTYIYDIPDQVYSDLDNVSDILSAHDFNQDIFGASRYPSPLSNFINETLHQKGGFWENIYLVGLCRHFECADRRRRRALAEEYTGGASGAVVRTMLAALEMGDAVLSNNNTFDTIILSNNVTEIEQSLSADMMMNGTATIPRWIRRNEMER